MATYSTYTDQDLLEKMTLGDEAAFAEIYDRYWKKTLAVAVHKISDVSEGESIVQDIFCSLWTRRAKLEISSSLNNYLMASVKYRVIKVMNKRRLERISASADLEDMDILDDSTQEYLNLAELTKMLEVLVGLLPETCQLVYRLNKEEGKSYKEIADSLGITEKAVDGHLSRAKKVLRGGLGSHLSSFLL